MDRSLDIWGFFKKKFDLNEFDSLAEFGNCYFVISPIISDLEHIVTTLCFAYLQEVEADIICNSKSIFLPIFSFPPNKLFSGYLTKNILQLILIDIGKFIYLESLPCGLTDLINPDPDEIKLYKLNFSACVVRPVLESVSLVKCSKDYSSYFLYICDEFYRNQSIRDTTVCKLIIATLSQILLYEGTLLESTKVCLASYSALLSDFNIEHLFLQANNVATAIIISNKMINMIFETVRICICCIFSLSVRTLLGRSDAICSILEFLTLEGVDIYLGVTSVTQDYQVKRQLLLLSRVFNKLNDLFIWHSLIEILCNNFELGLVSFDIDDIEMDNSEKVSIQVRILGNDLFFLKPINVN